MKDTFKNSLVFLKEKVDSYNDNIGDVVEISNISTLNDGDEFLESTSPIILSIVNVKEDSVSRSPKVYHHPNPSNDPTTINKYKNPARHFTLSLLFTAYNQIQTNEKYLDGISRLEHVIRCFQEQHVFYIQGTNEVPPTSPNHTKLILDIESLNMSELNQMWAILGNKYMPSVLYKMRLITIQHDDADGGKVVEQFKIKLWENEPEDLAGLIEETDYITKQP